MNKGAMKRKCDGVYCGGCQKSRGISAEMVYCRLFGIMIHRNHSGCKYHDGRMGANDDEAEGPEPEAGLAG